PRVLHFPLSRVWDSQRAGRPREDHMGGQMSTMADAAEKDEQFYRDLLTENYAVIEHAIRYVSRRHHLRPDDAEELASIVHFKLVEDGYAVLRKYRGRSSLATYLTTVISRILFDWR